MLRLLRLILGAGCVALPLLVAPQIASARPFWWDDQPESYHYRRRNRNHHRGNERRYRRNSSRNHFQLGVTAIYTAPLQDTDINIWGPGIGVRAGYTSSDGMYMGILGDMHLGESKWGRGAEYSVQGFFLGGQFGYDIRLGRRGSLRPSVAGGVHIVNSSIDWGRDTESETFDDLFFRPGVNLVWTSKGMYLGPELHFNIIMGEEETITSFMLAFTMGASL